MKRTLLPLLLAVVGLASTRAMGATSELFLKDEAHLDLFGTYLNNTSEKWGGGLGLDTYYGKYFGIGVVTHMENFTGTFIDNLAAEVTVRMPIEKFHLAPYVTGSYGYEFDNKDWFQSVGAGAEFRFSSNWGIFADYQWVFRHSGAEDGEYIRMGIRIAL
jgi:hypothetical protein